MVFTASKKNKNLFISDLRPPPAPPASRQMFHRYIAQALNKPLLRLFSTRSRVLTLFDEKCRSCGIKLQQESPDKPGFFKLGTSIDRKKPKYISEANQKYNQFLSKLDVSDRDLLINNFNVPKNIATKPISLTISKQEENPTVIEKDEDIHSDTNPAELLESDYTCIRCRDIHHRSKFTMNAKEFVIDELDKVLSTIPNDSPLVYVFSALDFPMGINPEIFEHRDPKDLYFIMTKTDNLFPKSSGSHHDYCKTFLNDYLGKKYNVPPENIFIGSGKKRWRVKRLYEFIPNYSYFIGHTNCGKSTLIKSIKVAEELKKFPGTSHKKDFGKTDKLIDKSFANVGPGVSHLPGFTRDIMPVYINGNKTIYDVPGFTSNTYLRNIYEKLDSKTIAHLFRGSLAQKKATYKSQYITVKGPNVLSIEGIGFLEFPENTMYQIRNSTDLKLHVFRDITKVESLLYDVPKSLYPVFLLQDQTPELSQFNRYLVPPFYGIVDLVLENIGYINIKPVGAKKTNSLVKFYLHPSINTIIRQPIMNYINKTFTGQDEKGNPLPKRDWNRLSTFYLSRYTNEDPFYSKLIPTTKADVNEYEQVNSFVSNGREYNLEYALTSDNKFDFWKE